MSTEIDLELCLSKMQETANKFYSGAVYTHNHTFIEFTGLINEYIKICLSAAKNGIDFTQANTHTGVGLPVKDYELKYLAEKLNCIFGPILQNADKKIRSSFLNGIVTGEFVAGDLNADLADIMVCCGCANKYRYDPNSCIGEFCSLRCKLDHYE